MVQSRFLSKSLSSEEENKYAAMGAQLQRSVLNDILTGGGTFVKEKNGIKIYKFDTKGDIAKFRAVTEMRVNMDAVRPFVVMDTTEKFNQIFSKFDPLFDQGEVIHRIPSNYKAPETPFTSIKWAAFKTPALISPRDFVFLEHSDLIEDDQGCRCALALVRSIELEYAPSQKGWIRGDILTSGYLFREVEQSPADGGAPRIEVNLFAQVDPKGWIPSWVANLAAIEQSMNLARIQEWFTTIPGFDMRIVPKLQARAALAPLPEPPLSASPIARLTFALATGQALAPHDRARILDANPPLYGRLILRGKPTQVENEHPLNVLLPQTPPPGALGDTQHLPTVLVLGSDALVMLSDVLARATILMRGRNETKPQTNLEALTQELDKLAWARLALALGVHPRWLSKAIFGIFPELHTQLKQADEKHETINNASLMTQYDTNVSRSHELCLTLFESPNSAIRTAVARATWPEVIDMACEMFPEASRVFHASAAQLSEIAFTTFVAQLRARGDDAVNELDAAGSALASSDSSSTLSATNGSTSKQTSSYMSASSVRNAAQTRLFLFRALNLGPSFTGDGWLRDAYGDLFASEWLLRNDIVRIAGSREIVNKLAQMQSNTISTNSSGTDDPLVYTYGVGLDLSPWIARFAIHCGTQSLAEKQPSIEQHTASIPHVSVFGDTWLGKLQSLAVRAKRALAPSLRHAAVGTFFSLLTAGILAGMTIVGKQSASAMLRSATSTSSSTVVRTASYLAI